MLAKLQLITDLALDRPEQDLNNGQRSNIKVNKHPVWAHCRDNLPRIMVWKLMKNKLTLEHDLEEDLLFYLLEKIDDLLADRMDVSTASESIGFEGPLWTVLPRNNDEVFIFRIPPLENPQKKPLAQN